MEETITFERFLNKEEIEELLKKIIFRGIYDENGNPLYPYKYAKFSLIKVHPPESPTSFPQVLRDFQPSPLFTAQPTIYKTQTDMLAQVDRFLQTIGKRINVLGFEGVQYTWEGRGRYHVLPPIIEKHIYPLSKGSFDLSKMAKRFEGCFVKDARGNLHELSKRFIKNFYVDQESKIEYLDIFNHNAELVNYGLNFNGKTDFYIICDGSHRLDYAIEYLNQPTNAILVEPIDQEYPLLPYYAFPIPFRPTTRLTSKEAEKKYQRLERDKIHLLNDFLKKTLHYDWVEGGLLVSKLRQQTTIY